MSVTVEKLEDSMAKLTIEVDAAAFTKALDKVYKKEKNRIQVPGFRKGKAPRKLVEQLYGKGIFYEDAANECINETYDGAVKESGEDVVSDPEIGVDQIEEGKNLIYTAKVALKPPVKLGKYLGVEITRRDPVVVTEDEIQAELKREQDANGKMEDVTDRPVQDGDTVRLDFEGTVDGKTFEGGTAKDYNLVIGSKSFIPGFEDQLIGLSAGDEKDVTVTFPEDYSEKSLAGKDAVFHCAVKGIRVKILPELNDAFADEVSEFSTLDEYKKSIEENLKQQKEKTLRQEKQNEAVDEAVKNAEIKIPDAMVKTQERNIAREFEQNLRYQYGNLDLNTYLQYMGTTYDQFLGNLEPQATQRILNSLVLEAVAKEQNLSISEEEFEAEYKRMADQYKIPEENVKNVFSTDEMKKDLEKDLLAQKAADLITDEALETKEPVKEEEKEPVKEEEKQEEKQVEKEEKNEEETSDAGNTENIEDSENKE